jgi:Mechanosensitive ion channel
VAARIVSGLVDAYTTREEDLSWSSLFSTLAWVVVMILGVLVVLQSLGIAISPIIAGLGLGGLALALALQDPLSNLFSGLLIITSRQLEPGDFVSLGANQQGYVQDIKWRNTTIRTLAYVFYGGTGTLAHILYGGAHTPDELLDDLRVAVHCGEDPIQGEALTLSSLTFSSA